MRVSPLITGITGEIRAIAPNRLKNASSGPNTTDGRRTVAFGNASRTAASPALARLQATVLERLPGKLLTRDQLEMLGRDNVVTPGRDGLRALGIAPTPVELVVPDYLARYRPGGGKRELPA